MATTTGVTRSGNQLIDGQLSGVKWVGALTYSDPALASAYTYFSDDDGDGISAQDEGFSRLSAAQLSAVHAVMSADADTTAARAGFSVEGLTGLDVSYAAVGSGAADVRLANSTDPGTAYAYYPNSSSSGGDVWFGLSGSDPVVGTYDHHGVMHEIGHALGLKHGHETWGYGPLPVENDSHEYSIMTYRSYPGSPGDFYTNDAYDGPQSFMMADIAALQYMYGADFTTNAGDTTYRWTPGVGTTFVDGQAAMTPGGDRIFLTVWDGGGQDTYDLSAYAGALAIDLAPGGYSTFSYWQRADLGGGYLARGNVYNALQFQGDARSLIENAIGGAGADVLRGNVAANRLSGGWGADRLEGLAGADVLRGGLGQDVLLGGDGDDMLDGDGGSDTLDGGAGYDTATYRETVRVDLAAGTVEFIGQAWTPETVAAVEAVVTGEGADFLFGDAADNRFSGGNGDDAFDGRAGTDRFDGGGGSDTVSYGAATASVRVDLVAGLASFPGQTAGAETLASIENARTGSGADVFVGNASGNRFIGGGGSDSFEGFGAGDAFDGGTGTDTVAFATVTVAVQADLGTKTIVFPGQAAGRLAGVENVVGGVAADLLTGSGAANLIRGGRGADTIAGAGGADVIVGGQGDDLFVYRGLSDSAPGAADILRAGDSSIALYNPGAGVGDRIDLRLIDANAGVTGDQGFAFGTATGVGRLWLAEVNDTTVVRCNVDASAAWEFECVIEDGATRSSVYSAADFLL